MTFSFKPWSLVALGLAVGACGGGGSGTQVPDGAPVLPFTDPYPGDQTEDLAVLSLDAPNLQTRDESAVFDQNRNEITGSILAGDTNSTLTFSALNSGGEVDFASPDGQEFSRTFGNTGTGGGAVGVVGMLTRVSDLPSGTATYSGSALVSILDAAGVYDLAGNATVSANFGANTVNVTLNGLSGTLQPPVGTNTLVSNVTTVTITGASIAGNGFSGGAVSASGFNTTGGTSSHEGAFFGNAAQEAGGVVAVDAANTDLLGLYLTSR